MQKVKSLFQLPILLWALLQIGCMRPSDTVSTSFYYWKTSFKLDPIEREALRATQTDRLFIRMMDVDTQGPQGEAIPISPISFPEPLADSIAIVPVVFIVNAVLKDMSEDQLEDLAKNIHQFVIGKMKQAGKSAFEELQIDCDWTVSTRSAYFSLLEKLRSKIGESVRLTATLRLHQVRNIQSSGIPPVDGVLLMCYNMGNLRKPGPHNSIMDLNEMELYLKDFLHLYPLAVDIALPLFSWSVVFRDGAYAGISKRLDPDLLKDTALFQTDGHPTLFRLKKALPTAGLRKNDVIRREETHYGDVLAAADFLNTHRKPGDFTLLFYHLDSQVLNEFPHEKLQAIHHRFN